MQFTRQIRVPAPRQQVWDFLWDVPRLIACVPGCENVEEIEPRQRYRALVKERVGPFKVSIPLQIEVLEDVAPERLVARASGRDGIIRGHVNVELTMVLREVGGSETLLELSTDVAVLGKLGTLGHSVIVRKGDAIVGHFATALQAVFGQEGR